VKKGEGACLMCPCLQPPADPSGSASGCLGWLRPVLGYATLDLVRLVSKPITVKLAAWAAREARSQHDRAPQQQPKLTGPCPCAALCRSDGGPLAGQNPGVLSY
jgi:hypothetical protein